MAPAVVMVEGVEYVPRGSQEISGDLRIVVLQRGWVMVGRLERDGDECILHDAAVIRRWGTTRGLGEIAADGPTDSTQLDPCYGEVRFHILTVVAMIAASEERWRASL